MSAPQAPGPLDRPWLSFVDDNGVMSIATAPNEVMRKVALDGNYWIAEVTDGVPQSEVLKIARLIAAAPDLLSAARVARGIIAAERKVAFDSNVVPGSGKLHGADAIALVASYDLALEQIDVAIGKAEVGS